MPVQYYCSHCQKRLSISRKKIGEMVACPVCQNMTVIPQEDQSSNLADSNPEGKIVFAEAEAPDELGSSQPSEPVLSGTDSPAQSIPDSEIDRFFQVADESSTPTEYRLQFRRERAEEEDLDLTPMVDVTFLLLIFFMITASFTLEKTIPTPVPDPNEQSAAQPIQPEDDLLEKSIQIEITAENTIRLDDKELADPQLLRDELTTSMQRDQKAEALVKVADAAHQETVVYVLDTANEVGMQKIR